VRVRCSVYVATSVDGYIAGPDGAIDWLARPEYRPEHLEGLSYEAFIATVDGLVMGRHTFETVQGFTPWPYEGVPVTVLTGKPLSVPPTLADRVAVDGGEPADVVRRLADKGHRQLYVDGGITIQRFLAAGLVDSIIITQIPILLGAGIPLFGPTCPETPLSLTDTAVSKNGMVQFAYRVHPKK